MLMAIHTIVLYLLGGRYILQSVDCFINEAKDLFIRFLLDYSNGSVDSSPCASHYVLQDGIKQYV